MEVLHLTCLPVRPPGAARTVGEHQACFADVEFHCVSTRKPCLLDSGTLVVSECALPANKGGGQGRHENAEPSLNLLLCSSNVLIANICRIICGSSGLVIKKCNSD